MCLQCSVMRWPIAPVWSEPGSFATPKLWWSTELPPFYRCTVSVRLADPPHGSSTARSKIERAACDLQNWEKRVFEHYYLSRSRDFASFVRACACGCLCVRVGDEAIQRSCFRRHFRLLAEAYFLHHQIPFLFIATKRAAN